jgi:hypothetical protein
MAIVNFFSCFDICWFDKGGVSGRPWRRFIIRNRRKNQCRGENIAGINVCNFDTVIQKLSFYLFEYQHRRFTIRYRYNNTVFIPQKFKANAA